MLIILVFVCFRQSAQNPASSSGSGWIELVLIEGRDLVAADMRGTSDPYVRIQYGNKKKKTKVNCGFKLIPFLVIQTMREVLNAN